jgi:hypothetical protein
MNKIEIQCLFRAIIYYLTNEIRVKTTVHWIGLEIEPENSLVYANLRVII